MKRLNEPCLMVDYDIKYESLTRELGGRGTVRSRSRTDNYYEPEAAPGGATSAAANSHQKRV